MQMPTRTLNTTRKILRKLENTNKRSKTKLIYFSKKQKITPTPIKMYNNILLAKPHTKYLDITLDQKLTYSKHISDTSKITNKATASLYPIFNKYTPLSQNIKLLIYKTYILPNLLYACPTWSNTNINKLQKIQNKPLRIILRKTVRTKITNLHKITNIPTIKSILYDSTKKFFAQTVKYLIT